MASIGRTGFPLLRSQRRDSGIPSVRNGGGPSIAASYPAIAARRAHARRSVLSKSLLRDSNTSPSISSTAVLDCFPRSRFSGGILPGLNLSCSIIS
jgi:hypothetical protein